MRRDAAAVLIAAAAALGGCGGSDLSPAALRARADPICRQANAREKRIRTPSELAQAKPFLRAGIAALAPELRQLQRLHARGSATSVYRRALNGVAAELRELRESVRALEHGAETVLTVKTLQRRLAPVERDADEAWRSLRIRDCLSR